MTYEKKMAEGEGWTYKILSCVQNPPKIDNKCVQGVFGWDQSAISVSYKKNATYDLKVGQIISRKSDKNKPLLGQ